MPLDPQLLQLYVPAVLVLILIPGPDTLLVLGRSLFDGRRTGLVAIAGITLGNLIHTGLAAAGLSAVIAASAGLFEAVRLAGAGYLAWLGLRALFDAWAGRDTVRRRHVPAPRRAFLQALTTNLLNVKVILFYLAFVPQFVAPALGHVPLQMVLLGLGVVVLGALYLAGLCWFAAGVAGRAMANPAVRRVLDLVSGVLFLGFALRLVLARRAA